jgi:RND family efflux transporter MFP subunit
MTFEHEDENIFDQKIMALCETVVSLIGPILFEKSLRDRWFGAKLREALKAQLKKLREPGSLALKVCAAGTVGVVAFLIFATGEYRVTADATLEGTVQRVIGSPVAGYIIEAAARAGDIVTKGQLLARLDDKDLELERVKWSSEKIQLQREYRRAMAEHDSSRVSILKAQLDQATARLALTEEYLSRMRVTAPMNGVIISGDLSQSLGTPVERGDALFAIAPLDSYRVMLDVDERDVRQLSPGQSGRLALVGFPDEYLPFEIERITPIATPEDGRNFFAVEARLEQHPERLRPGMEGVGKIDTGRRRLIWIWTHRLIDWFHLWAWTWTP